MHTLTPTLTSPPHPVQRVTTTGKGARGAGDHRDLRVGGLTQMAYLFSIS